MNNYYCEGQIIGRLVHFCSRDAMDIRGMSEETIKAIRNNIFEDGVSKIEEVCDLYSLKNYKEELLKIDRFGETKVNNLLVAIENSKTQPLNRVIYGLSIPQIGKTASKKIADVYNNIHEIKEYGNSITLSKLLGNSVGDSFCDNFLMNSNINNIINSLSIAGLTMTQPQENNLSNKLE